FQKHWAIQKPRWDREEKEKADRERAKQKQKGAAGDAASTNDTIQRVTLNFNPKEKVGYSSYRLLFRVLMGMYGRKFVISGLLKALYDATNFAQPILLQNLVAFITASQNQDPNADPPPAGKGYGFAAG